MNRNPYSPPESKLEGIAPDSTGVTVPSISARLYSSQQIFVASLIGSPIAAAWFAAANLKALAQPQKARQLVYWGIAVTIAMLGLAFVLPVRTPTTVLPLTCSFAFRAAAEKKFGEILARHLSAGGTKGSWWLVIGVSLALTLAAVACFILLLLVLDLFGLKVLDDV